MRPSLELLRWLLFLAAIISLTNIVIHDFSCHEELHRLASPIHHAFNFLDNNFLDLGQADHQSHSLLYINLSLALPSGFTPSIFHPPD
ncbi:MAG: hypothetical protein ACP5SQ_00175 [Candidatus Saccharicenans sp.]